MQIKVYRSFLNSQSLLYQNIFYLTKSLVQIYPDYEKWYHQTFLSGLQKGERGIVVAEEKGKLMGLALFKDTPTEKKLCTLFVPEVYRQRGIGTKILKTLVKELKQNPLTSVSEEHLPQVLPLFNKMKFRVSACKKGVYMPQSREYYFNDDKAESIQKKLIPVLIHRIKQLTK